VLHTLIGYSDQPSVMQALVYGLALAAIFTLSKVCAPPRRVAGPAAAGKSSIASA